jgi:hypothetical protein
MCWIFALRRRAAAAAFVFAAVVVLVPSARAQEPEPRTYSNAPVGMNFVVVAYNPQWGSLLFDPALPVENASANIQAIAVGFAHSLDVFGTAGKVSVSAPIVSGRFRGEYLGEPAQATRRGLGDVRVMFVTNFLGAPALDRASYARWRQRTIAGASLQVVVPIGAYDADRLLNVGTNRWAVRPGVGMSRQAGPWIVEGTASVTFFSTNREFLRSHRFTQRPIGLFEINAIRYFTPRIWGGLHALWVVGGAGVVDGGPSGESQNNARFGASVSLPLAAGHSLKLGVAESAITRFGNDFVSLSVVYQRGW